MAAIYKERPGEVHIYVNRIPKADGGDPWLLSAWLLAFYCSITLSFVAFMLWYGLYTVSTYLFIGMAVASWWFLCLIAATYKRVVFSARDEEAWSSLFFFKWDRTPFAELNEIKLRDQEVMGRVRYSYVATRRDKYKPPVQLSCAAKDMRRLSRFYYDIVPKLQEMLADFQAVDALEVAVEEFVVPVTQAADLLGEPVVSTEEPAVEPAVPEVELGVYYPKTGGAYRRTFWVWNICTYIGMSVFASGGLYYFLTNFMGYPFQIGALSAVLAFLFMTYQYARENMDINFEPKTRRIHFITMFGLRRKTFSYDDLIKFNIKNLADLGGLCMVLEGQKVDPTLLISRSPDKLRDALHEVCALMGLDPDEWFDG